jgi:16S rRNA (cytosine1402-N4)-methyltransferase
MEGTQNMTEANELQHVAVLRDAVLAGLAVRPAGCYLDGTFGRGGHARALLECLGPGGRLLLMDRDPDAIAQAQRDFGADPRVAIWHGNFADLDQWPAARAGLDGVLLDLGVSSPQLDDAARGFSFRADAPLDMRMDPGSGETAADFLARADAAEIADVLYRYGEERMNRRIARAIVARREREPIRTTRQLAGLVERVLGRRERHKPPATRTFQALRVYVNDELGALERALPRVATALRPGGRLAVISFHSLEDRIVKRFLRGEGESRRVPRGLPRPPVEVPPLRPIGRARKADTAEIARNPRSRAAVLRVAEKRGSETAA